MVCTGVARRLKSQVRMLAMIDNRSAICKHLEVLNGGQPYD